MADFDPNAINQPQAFTPQQQQPNIQIQDSLYNQPPQVIQDLVADQIPEGCAKVFKLVWWQTFFNSTTNEVMKRALQSVIIFKGDFLKECELNKPDLWYPSWIVITMIFASFITSILTSMIENKSSNSSTKSVGIFSGIIIVYAFVVPAIEYAISYCLDLEDLNYLVILDLVTYSFTILLPIMVFFPLFTLVTGTNWMQIASYIIFAFCAVWSEIFVVYHGIRYILGLATGSKGQKIGISLSVIILHAAFLIAIGCLMFLY